MTVICFREKLKHEDVSVSTGTLDLILIMFSLGKHCSSTQIRRIKRRDKGRSMLEIPPVISASGKIAHMYLLLQRNTSHPTCSRRPCPFDSSMARLSYRIGNWTQNDRGLISAQKFTSNCRLVTPMHAFARLWFRDIQVDSSTPQSTRIEPYNRLIAK